MDRQARIEGPGGSGQSSRRLQRSGAITLVVMVDRPYFRAARGHARCQGLFDAAALRTRAEATSAAHPVLPSGAPGLGVFGDSVLASELAG